MYELEKIIVLCPGGSVTGGPELLHQLVHELRESNQDAYVSYYPFGVGFSKPSAYDCYDAPQSDMIDEEGVGIVVPEISTSYLRKTTRATKFVWWLSVDNYIGTKHKGFWPDLRGKMGAIIKNRRVALRGMRDWNHLTQSAYAADFLAKNGIKSSPLGDYLSAEHFRPRSGSNTRRNIVAFNPKKGQRTNKMIMEAFSDIDFCPIVNMSRLQVADLLATAKVYMDFGHHPGKDRIPREAAMAGCCVVTGTRGSAAFYEDVPIDAEFKIEEGSESFMVDLRKAIELIFDDFEGASRRFEHYRGVISAEQRAFKAQVASLFRKPPRV